MGRTLPPLLCLYLSESGTPTGAEMLPSSGGIRSASGGVLLTPKRKERGLTHTTCCYMWKWNSPPCCPGDLAEGREADTEPPHSAFLTSLLNWGQSEPCLEPSLSTLILGVVAGSPPLGLKQGPWVLSTVQCLPVYPLFLFNFKREDNFTLEFAMGLLHLGWNQKSWDVTFWNNSS